MTVTDRKSPYLVYFSFLWLLLSSPLAGASLPEETGSGDSESREAFDEAQRILNDSPWARQQTITRVVPGVGSGEYGEKEIFSRYFVRVLSARPIRSALEAIQERITGRETSTGIPDPGAFLIIGVSFRSNQPDLESQVQNVLRSQTLETLKNRAYLSTDRFPQLEIVDYFPPTDLAVGGQFVFPRQVNGIEVIAPDDGSFAFELDLPGRRVPELRVTFPVTEEILSPEPEASDREPLETARFQIISSGRSDETDTGRFAGVINRFPEQQAGRALNGTLYLFHRNDNLDARNFFDPVGEPLPEFKRNQFGLSVGWQLNPDLNLFGSYDGLRIVQGSTLLSNVPSPEMKRGDFSALLQLENPIQLLDPDTNTPFPGNRIPEDRISPVAQKLLPLLPNPNRNEAVRNFVNSQPLVENRDVYVFRTDWQLNEENQLVGLFELSDGNGISVHPLPAFGGRELEKEYESSIRYTRNFGASTVVAGRVEFDRAEELALTRSARNEGLLDSLGIEGVKVEGPEDEGYPSFELAGYPSFGDEGLPQTEIENRYSFEGEMTLARGNHLFQLSGDLTFRQLNDSRSNSLERGEFSFSGLFTGDAFADFLMGRADTATRAIGNSRQDLRAKSWNLFISDEWRVHPQVTLTLGAGYNFFEPFHSIRDNISVFRPLLFEPPLDGDLIDHAARPTDEGEALTVVEPDRNDWSTQLGLAFRPFGSNRVVLRASYSLFYEPTPSYLFEHYMGRNYPHYFLQSSQASLSSRGLDLTSPFLTETATELTVRDIEPGLRTPYEQFWNFSLQNQISDTWDLDLSFRGRRSVHDIRILPANVPLPASGPIQARRPNPDFGRFSIVSGGGSSLFYEGQVELRKRFVDGYTFDATFEWRRRFDADFDDEPSNPRNLNAEWGPADGFPARRLVLNFIYDLPFGRDRLFGGIPVFDSLFGDWRLSGIARISSGTPLSVVLPGDPNNDGISGDRPDRLASGAVPEEERNIDRWLDPNAFAFPAPYAFGNAGRNILVGPGYHNWDMSLIKDFFIAGDQRLQVRFAFFNAFNHPNFENPGGTLGTRTFGVITGADRAREIEIALKYSF